MNSSSDVPYHLKISETAGKPQLAARVKVGIPLPQGVYFHCPHISIQKENGENWPCEILTTALWPDKSIKWCLLNGFIDLDARESVCFKLTHARPRKDANIVEVRPNISESDTHVIVRSQQYTFYINKREFQLFDRVENRSGNSLIKGARLNLGIGNLDLTDQVNRLHYHSVVANGFEHGIELVCGGELRNLESDLILYFESRLDFNIVTDTVDCSFCIHNPKPAKHPHGLWDLGDPNSLFFDHLEFKLELAAEGAVSWSSETTQPRKELIGKSVTIYQESSGGKNWRSHNHVNAANEIPLKISGYQCTVDEKIVNQGQRASPNLQIKTELYSLQVTAPRFWQNFPKSIRATANSVDIGLFPSEFKERFELQAGEKKTHQFTLSFSDSKQTVGTRDTPPAITINPDWITRCRVFPFFNHQEKSPLSDIINNSLHPEHGFFAKREIIDEYGWRNFGDLYADHETEGLDVQPGDFISHYNNQYDPIYGFIRQFVATGDHRWFELADDLARHVSDIDLYHTEFDKDEYNNGMFWHTDHYQQAKTSSHRSYSRLQEKDAYIDHAGGGGPGGQHCYTTGLLYHYLLTGDESSRQAVFKLQDWITRVYEGSGGILDTLVAIKNRNRIDLKSIYSGQYPLDRGTGNYINTLLDVYELTQVRTTLENVEHIIRNTVHPKDDLDRRDLTNVEIRWFYTVFFQALARYLTVKEALQETDAEFYYARDTLLHYADRMVAHEQPYLEHPEILEFPNNTWTAQHLRKVNLLVFADYYAPERNPAYLSKAESLYEDIINRLEADPHHYYTRIQAILMQNIGVFEYFNCLPKKNRFESIRDYAAPTKHSPLRSAKNLLITLGKAILQFSWRQELQWLARRSSGLARILRYQP